MDYIQDRLGFSREQFITVRESSLGKQAEIERCTLNNYNDKAYNSDIKTMANIVLKRAGLKCISERKRKI